MVWQLGGVGGRRKQMHSYFNLNITTQGQIMVGHRTTFEDFLESRIYFCKSLISSPVSLFDPAIFCHSTSAPSPQISFNPTTTPVFIRKPCFHSTALLSSSSGVFTKPTLSLCGASFSLAFHCFHLTVQPSVCDTVQYYYYDFIQGQSPALTMVAWSRADNKTQCQNN